MREFLLETSVLDRLSGELCDTVTGRAESQARLEAIERTALFLVPLDEVRGWWRYHHLFADLLRARLQRDRPGRVVALHAAAAAWHEEHGLADDALRHAVGAGETVWAARLIERYFDAIFLPGQRVTIQRWLAGLPAELVRSRLRLALAQMWMALVGGHLEAAGIALEAAGRASADAAEEPFEPSAGRAASVLANIPARPPSVMPGSRFSAATPRARPRPRHRPAASWATVTRCRELRLPAGGWLWLIGSGPARRRRARLRFQRRGVAGGRSARPGRGSLQSPRPCAARPGPPGRRARHPPAGAGDHHTARPAGLARCGHRVRGHGGGGIPAGRARRRLEHVTKGIARLKPVNYTQPVATGLVTLAWIRLAQGDAAGGREAMGEARAGRAKPGRGRPD